MKEVTFEGIKGTVLVETIEVCSDTWNKIKETNNPHTEERFNMENDETIEIPLNDFCFGLDIKDLSFFEKEINNALSQGAELLWITKKQNKNKNKSVTIQDIVNELNNKNKELVREMDNLGFTSQGHKAEYYSQGRTIYKGTFSNHKYLNPLKVGVFIKDRAEQIRLELIEKEIDSVLEYFRKAKSDKNIQERVFSNKAELALALMKGEKWRVKGTYEGYCFYEESNVINDTKIPFRFGTNIKSTELDGWWECANNIDVWEKVA